MYHNITFIPSSFMTLSQNDVQLHHILDCLSLRVWQPCYILTRLLKQIQFPKSQTSIYTKFFASIIPEPSKFLSENSFLLIGDSLMKK